MLIQLGLVWIYFVTSSMAQYNISSTKPKEMNLNGITINIVAEQDTIRKNPDLFVEEFFKLTGINVKIIGKPKNMVIDEILATAQNQLDYFDGYIFSPNQLPDYCDCAKCPASVNLVDLTERIRNDDALNWDGLATLFRSVIPTYNGRIYAIPYDGDFHFLYYRNDLLKQLNVAVPKTWEDYLDVAKRVTDAKLKNYANETIFGSCLSKGEDWMRSDFIEGMITTYTQTKGSNQGGWFNTTTMEPLFKNEGLLEALRIYNETIKYGPPNDISGPLSLGNVRDLLNDGRCALMIDWGDMFNTSQYRNVTRMGRVGGTSKVVDRATGKLVSCDAQMCPFAQEGINYAPEAVGGFWSGGINAWVSDARRREATYQFLSYMGQKNQIDRAVLSGNGFEMSRLHQMTESFWTANGLDAAAAKDIVGRVKDGFNNENIANYYRIPGSSKYAGALQYAVGEMIVGNFSFTQVQSYLYDKWQNITNELGRKSQVQRWRKSINLQALPEFECGTGCLNGGSCIANDKCQCTSNYIGILCEREKCPGGCANGGICIAENRCDCQEGFTGSNCKELVLPVSLGLSATDPYVSSSGAAGALAFFAALGLLYCAILALLLVKYRANKDIKSNSPLFNALILIGCILGFITIFISIGPKSNNMCLADIWVSFSALGLILGNLLAKNFRIYMIFMRTARPNSSTMMSDSNILKISSFFLLIEIILLAIWTGVGAPQSIISKSSSTSWFQTCQVVNQGGVTLAGIMAAYNSLLVVLILFLAYATRSVAERYRDSKNIALVAYVLIGTFVVGGIILGSGSINPVTQNIIRLFLTILLLFSTTTILIGYKLGLVMSGRKVQQLSQTSDKQHPSQSGKAAMSAITSLPATTGHADFASFQVALMNKTKAFGRWEDGKLALITMPSSNVIVFMSSENPTESYTLLGNGQQNFQANMIKSGQEDQVEVKFSLGNTVHRFVIDARTNESNAELCTLFKALGNPNATPKKGEAIQFGAHLAHLMATSSTGGQSQYESVARTSQI